MSDLRLRFTCLVKFRICDYILRIMKGVFMAVKRPSLVKPSSGSSTLRGGFSGTSGKIPTVPSWQASIRDAMINGTSSYRDINNAFSAGGHNGTGSLQSSVVNSGTAGKKHSGSSRGSPRGSSGGFSGDYSGGYSASPVSSASDALDYYEAPIAKYYGFGRSTAYQEALANTAYRREMDDMRKAGLNPSVIYGSHNTSGADSNIYPRDESANYSYGGSGGSGGYGRRSRGGNSGKYVFSGGAYYGIMAAVGTVAAAATKNVGAGMAAAGLAGTAMKAINGFFKK